MGALIIDSGDNQSQFSLSLSAAQRVASQYGNHHTMCTSTLSGTCHEMTKQIGLSLV